MVPWHTAHLASKSCLPSATVPLPAGRPAPSGRTSMSQSAISSCVTGRPKLSAYAAEANNRRTIEPSRVVLIEYIAHLSVCIDAPGLLRVVVKQSVGSHLRDERFTVWLDIAFVIRGSAGDLGRLPIPLPIHLKARLRLAHDRPGEL